MRTCPHCGDQQDASMSFDGISRPPAVGDVGLCWACGEWLVVTKTGTRIPTDGEYWELGVDPRYQSVRELWLRGRDPGEGGVPQGSPDPNLGIRKPHKPLKDKKR